ncbi:histidinol dehydrogenase [Desulforamulus hydrothermalis]|uniref:Histidinol dehydrogenase n=1 Tax=Desulforamulus hydrothermalis Lam5 = DSM 18033 TaxID=1121428 RepID=K8EL31_9FIRM|nr:histidinol dehydrogenase [Desulforamulus hydrothermalis]CCO09236.1 Histidinol dehydrogenase [Desulforamulus hydrothermalis Lam5 = DSM 18033]SHH05890.1 histidinol dehydrogenase [Desulforamulus hydrothermalis Lam5 = DSM 18033]
MAVIKIINAQDRQAIEALFAGRTAHQAALAQRVAAIVEEVRQGGDEALCRFTKQFDQADISPAQLKVSREEIEQAYRQVDRQVLASLQLAKERIAAYHRQQLSRSWFQPDRDGAVLGQLILPLERVGIYVPGGTASYPSSVLMNAVPAKVAGVPQVVMVTPPAADGRVNPYTLVAAAEAGVDEIYKAGGAQAIAALAYGTSTIARVDKITGPGNIYVTLAKRMVYGQVDIDMLAGPSEILVVADGSANPAYAAADLLSQAEHDTLAAAVLITHDRALAQAVSQELAHQVSRLPRQEIARQSLANHSAIILTGSLDESLALANDFAPEHLELLVEEPFQQLGRIRHAGAVFLGHYSPEPVGDYLAGPNHVLPTGGTARFYSPLNVDTFLKKCSVIAFSKESLNKLGPHIVRLAETEGLAAHANAVRIRLKDNV